MSLEADELRHYGVRGMRWGVRKNPSKAFIKASRKADKLSRHADKMERNYQKANVDLAKQKARFANTNRKARGKLDVGTLEDQTVANVSAETTVALLKEISTRSKVERDRWVRSMSEAFSTVRVDDLSPKALKAGRDYVNMLLAE